MKVNVLTEYDKVFHDCCFKLSEIFKESFELTEKDLGYSLDDETKKLCICIGLFHVLNRFGDK